MVSGELRQLENSGRGKVGPLVRGLPLITYVPRGREGGSSLLYISIAYFMQKGGEGVQIACKIAYVFNGRPLKSVRAKSVQSCITLPFSLTRRRGEYLRVVRILEMVE